MPHNGKTGRDRRFPEICAVSSRYDVALATTLTKFSRTIKNCTIKHDATSCKNVLPLQEYLLSKAESIDYTDVPGTIMPRTLPSSLTRNAEGLQSEFEASALPRARDELYARQ